MGRPKSKRGLQTAILLSNDKPEYEGSLMTENENLELVSDSDESVEIEILLSGSRMGTMRRGVSGLIANTWTRIGSSITPAKKELEEEEEKKEGEGEEEEEMDPVRRLEVMKENVRRLESAENAGRDPCLFSKRTAFDIRMDQIEEKPWCNNPDNVTDYFNYGLSEEDWLEYAEHQLAVRQELTDASRQKRVPDPSIVTVLPKTPSKQSPKVAVATATPTVSNQEKKGDTEEDPAIIGPVNEINEEEEETKAEVVDDTQNSLLKVAGAWGAGVAANSALGTLIQEQLLPKPPIMIPPPPPPLQTTQPYRPVVDKNIPPPPQRSHHFMKQNNMTTPQHQNQKPQQSPNHRRFFHRPPVPPRGGRYPPPPPGGPHFNYRGDQRGYLPPSHHHAPPWRGGNPHRKRHRDDRR